MAIVEFLASAPGARRRFQLKSPVDLSVIGEYACADASDVAAAVLKARAAQQAWAALPVRQRAALVIRARDVVRANSRVKHKIGRPLVISQFTRTIRVLVPGQRIEETYDEGQLIGTGIWTFTQNQDKTIAAYHCAVKANTLLVNIGFKVSGAFGHHLVFNSLLQALKKRCEGGNGVA